MAYVTPGRKLSRIGVDNVADRSLQIGIDAREILGKPTGVGRYLAGLLSRWSADAAFPHRVTLFAPAKPAGAAFGGDGRFSWHVSVSPRAGTWWEQTALPAAAREARVDVFFGPGYTLPLRLHCPSVVAIHDVSFFAHPEWFGWRERRRRRWLTHAAAKRSRRVVTISQFSSNEIVRWLGVSRDRIVVAPPGPPDHIVEATASVRPPVVLFVGSLFARRHVPELIEGFALASRQVPGAKLVLAGDNRTQPRIDPIEIARSHGVESSVEWREYVSDDDLAALYAQARVFAFLSEYEGFAMTPLEAIAHGVAPVLLDTPVAREVYGDAARLVTLAPPAMAGALVELLQQDDTRATLLAAGRRALARFSWAESATIVRRALEDAATA